MANTKDRRFYRLEPDETSPVLLHLQSKTYKTVDISITGLKIEVDEMRPEWKIGEIIDVIIEFSNKKLHPPIDIKTKICYLGETHLGLEYVDMTVLDKRNISEYVLQRTKSMGLW